MTFNKQPIKLQDCRVHGFASGAELFLVEGDSAASAVAQLRNTQCQAVLPMQGKPMNALKASPQKLLANPWFAAVLAALGVDLAQSGTSQIEKLRYERIVLLMDPDADGIHCGVLLLLFFYRHLPELLQAGRVHSVHAPVGEVIQQDSGEVQLAYTEAQFQALCGQQRQNPVRNPTAYTATKYRGLAGIDSAQLERLCINPRTRNSRCLQPADAQLAMEIFGGVSAT